MIKAILWDIDGTLLNFRKAEETAIRKGFEEFDLGECSDEMLEDYSEINRRYWEALERKEISKPVLLVKRFEEFFTKYGIDAAVSKEFNAFYQKALGETAVYNSNARETVEYLKGKVLQCAVTNGTKIAQDGKLKNSGLDLLLDEIFISECLGYEKPDVRFFDIVFDRIPHFEKDEMMIVGDSLTSDIKGGRNAGIITCLYDPDGRYSDDCADYRIKDIGTVLAIM